MNPFLAEIYAQTGGMIHKHKITYNGVEVVFHVKELVASEVTKLYAPINTEDEAAKAVAMQELPARLIAAMACDADGKPLFTEEEAAALPNALAMPIRDRGLKANGLAGEEGKKKDEAPKVDAQGKA